MMQSTSPGEVNGASRLTPRHLADLRKSGLTAETISACDFYSVQAPATVQKLLRWKCYHGELGACLAIPFNDQDGKPTGYVRLKPDSPRTAKQKDGNGRIVKYESPKGSTNRAFFPPGTLARLHDASVPLVITEGEKKAAAADQHGFASVGVTGVWNWQLKRNRDANGMPTGERELINDLAGIPWKGRLVYLTFDSDAATNRMVLRAESCLAEVLARHDATVRIVRLPAGDLGADGMPRKVGLDDYLIAHGPEAFRQLLAEAKAPGKPLLPIEATDDPHRLARLFLSKQRHHDDGLILRYWREEWYRWNESVYRVLPDADLRAELTQTAKAELDRVNIYAQTLAANGATPRPTRKITRSLIGNVELNLTSLTLLPADVEPPAWCGSKGWQRRNLIALTNGLLDLDALFAGKSDVLLPHTPRWFSPVCLPYPFDADAACPRWQEFLEHNLQGDAGRIALLQEWFGLCLTPDTSRQKFLVLEGDGANGKSVVCAALEAVLGSENCSHVPLEDFGERFQLTPTLAKLANIASEVGELDKAAEGFLKSFTSGDPMQFDRKYKPPMQAVPTARLVLATNNRPRFSDRSGGIWRRMILMPFRVVIAENDPGRILGMDKPEWWVLSGELPGMLNWSLTGLDRLCRQNRFTRSEVCEQALAEYRTENNPARMFLLEMCRETPEGQVPCGELYKAYRAWCNANGYSPLADRMFGKEVRRVFSKVERREVGPRDSRLYAYCGLFMSLPAAFGG
jgi:P4 family phage/plasmid primase-like protien